MAELFASTSGPSPLCPSCGRYMGPVRKCPYCDADGIRSPVLACIRVAAVVLATLGLGLLFVASQHREPPVTEIADISPLMNFAHVRIRGHVCRKPYVGKDGDYVGFTVDDGTAKIRVVAYRNVARELIDAKVLPESGEYVECRGDLNVAANERPKLTLRLAAHLERLPDRESQAL